MARVGSGGSNKTRRAEAGLQFFSHCTGNLGWVWKWRGGSGKRLRNLVGIAPRRGLKDHKSGNKLVNA